MFETGERHEFTVGDQVQVKRTDGSWNIAKVCGVYVHGLEVEFLIGNTFRGHEYNGEQKMAYKYVPESKYKEMLKSAIED